MIRLKNAFPLILAVQAAWLSAWRPAGKPAPLPPRGAKVLPDRQKISAWRWAKTWYKFYWDDADAALKRPVTFAVTVPAGHDSVTVAIDDANGVRVRNLLEGADVATIGGKRSSAKPQTLAFEWNGLDDRGRTLPDGDYRVSGLSLPPVKLTYEYSWLGPGTPPWVYYKNSGWGGDHEFPHAIACIRGHGGKPWRVVTGGRTAEGGSPGFVLDANDRKCHSFGNGWTGPSALACGDGMVWIGLGKDLIRVDYHTAKPRGFRKPLKFKNRIDAIAVGTDRFAVLLRKPKKLDEGRVILFEKSGAKQLAEWPMKKLVAGNCLAFDLGGRKLYFADGDGLRRCDAAQAKPRWEPLKLPALASPGVLCFDRAGNLYVFDSGPDWRVKVYNRDLKLLRSIGTRGGQAGKIDYDAGALHNVQAMSVDDDGLLWVAEDPGACDEKKFPKMPLGYAKRISVWGRDGKLVKDFVGGTQYGAYSTALHEQDPTIGYAYGVLYKLTPGKKPAYRPWRYIMLGRKPGSPFGLWTSAPHVLFNGHRVFRSNASGRMREYLLQTNGLLVLLCADARGNYRPVMAIGHHQQNKAFPKVKGEPKALHVWSDLNGDEMAQPGEFQRLAGTSYEMGPYGGWGCPPPRDLVFYIEGLALKPVRFTQAGGPVYDAAKAPRLATSGPFLRVGGHLVGYMKGRFGNEDAGPFFCGFETYCDLRGRRRGRLRRNWPAVHGSWFSSLYVPGQSGRTIGELFPAGIADSRGEAGYVICHQGNKGQGFIISEDGLYVTGIFRDVRQSPAGFGATEKPGADWTNVTLDSEAFGGWFGRQDDGVLRYNFGRVACRVVRIDGLEKAKRFTAGTVKLAGPPKGLSATSAPAAAPKTARELLIPNVRGRFPRIQADGDPADWPDVPTRKILVGGKTVARVRLATDYDHLYILAEVIDSSPAINAAADPKRLFKTGDAIDLQFGPWRLRPGGPGEGDTRTVLAAGPAGKKKPVAMVFLPVSKRAKPKDAVTYQSPTGKRTLASAKPLNNPTAVFRRTATGYVLEAKLPCDRIGLGAAGPGAKILGDVGVIFSTAGGLGVQSRAYLHDHSPGATIVSDTPSESDIRPAEWGAWVME